MSVYYDDILNAAGTALAASSALAAVSGLTIKHRPRPVFVRDADVPPVLIVSMPPDGFEEVYGLTSGTNAFGEALLDFPVVCTLVFQNNQDAATRTLVCTVRQAVWEALWKPLSPGYDVEYDPSPGTSAAGLADPLDAAVQKFTYRRNVPRSA